MSSAPLRNRAPVTLTLSQEAHAALMRLGGRGDRGAVVEALLWALEAGNVLGFEGRLELARATRRAEQRARGLAARGNLRGRQR